ncbi:MAG: hypothetical protein M3Y54_01125 [Bacteroidota bacterium]|nr:hypothetical protein [Bacteroidota bacterium]
MSAASAGRKTFSSPRLNACFPYSSPSAATAARANARARYRSSGGDTTATCPAKHEYVRVGEVGQQLNSHEQDRGFLAGNPRLSFR